MMSTWRWTIWAGATGAWLSKGAFRALKERINPERYGAAPLLGDPVHQRVEVGRFGHGQGLDLGQAALGQAAQHPAGTELVWISLFVEPDHEPAERI